MGDVINLFPRLTKPSDEEEVDPKLEEERLLRLKTEEDRLREEERRRIHNKKVLKSNRMWKKPT